MAKRRTKDQRIEAEKAALRQRILDMAAGANVEYDDDEGVLIVLNAEAFGGFLLTLRDRLLGGCTGNGDHLIHAVHFDAYDDIGNLVDTLYDAYGIRADGSHLKKGAE